MRTKRLVFGGVGIVLTAAVVIVATLFIRDVTTTQGRATTSAQCAGASIDLTVGTLPDSEAVFAQVLVSDGDTRAWEVEWPTGRRVSPTLRRTSLPHTLQGFQILGDTDDGMERTVRLRPKGAQDWCEVSANFS